MTNRSFYTKKRSINKRNKKFLKSLAKIIIILNNNIFKFTSYEQYIRS